MRIANLLAGVTAGVVSSLVFTIIHGLIISPIWFMLVPMAFAGAMCGFFLSGSYEMMVERPSSTGWLRYNFLFIVLLFLPGPISLVLFDPIMTIPELISSPNGLPDELFREVLPFVAIYIPLMALTITSLYGRRWQGFGVVLITCAVLMFLLGMNIAPMGLVFLSDGWVKTLLKLVGLIVALNLVYVVFYLLLGYLWAGKSAVSNHLTT